MSEQVSRVQALLSRLREDVDKARVSDYVMPVVLPFVPAILLAIGAILFFIGIFRAISHEASASLTVTGLGLMVLAIAINIYVLYKWIERRNTHFERTLSMFKTISELATLLGFNRAQIIASRVRELELVSTPRRVGLNIVLSIFVPFYIFYVYHFLNKDFHTHSQKERLVLAELFDELRERDPHFMRRYEELVEVPDRSTLLYIVLYLVTIGFFGIYWVYTLTEDPNKHFESHALIDREILASLERISASATR